MNRPLVTACAGMLVLALNLPLGALAGTTGPQSDQDLRYARGHVEYDIDMLQRDQRDYSGHRVKAIEAFQDARQQLTWALAYDRNRGDNTAVAPFGSASALRGPGGSDANLIAVRQDVERVLDLLQADNHDYGGHRVDAIARLQQGRQQIIAALRADGIH